MTETARMYGGSLYWLGGEEGLDEHILGELEGVTALLNGDAEYLHLLSIPSIPKKERCALLDQDLPRASPPLCAQLYEAAVRKGALQEAAGRLRPGLPPALQ